jgi:hypothetical protein
MINCVAWEVAYQQEVEAHLVGGALAVVGGACPILRGVVAAGHEPVAGSDC